MTIFRGPGGTGSATSDSDTTEFQEFLVQSQAARDAALAAQAAAELAETNAETAETNAETAETNAETAATNAASSASAAASSALSASTSATNAASSASAASTSATNASASASAAAASASAALTSENNAETAETNAAASASAAASSASTATTQASNAAASASAALALETAAASSASSASTSATNAASSASSASTSATNASSSASAASTSATAAASSASSASTSASTATTKASEASTSATNAATSASSASTSASTATTQASNAASSASAAATSASSASTAASTASAAQTAAESARDAALSTYDNFDDRYLGPKTTDPTLDNDGNALLTGALYFNTSSNVMKVYTGSAWVAAYVSAAGVLLAANNLSDVASTATSRTNLNVPTRTGGDASGTWSIDITGNSATTTNGVVTTGSYANPAWITSLAGSKVSGNISGNAGNVTGTVAVVNGGTGSTTASAARTALGVAIGTNVQAYSPNLSAYASTGIGFRNRIINGDMRIDQRNAGGIVTPILGTFIVDRWAFLATQTSKATAQQNAAAVTPPTGFQNYLGITSSSAYSVLSSDTFGVYQNVEGFNSADFGWGTANAQTVALSFWVRSSLTGTFSGGVSNSAENRSYVFNYTVSVANTWEQKTVTIPGDTSGTWLTTNGIGLRLRFGLGSGATYTTTSGSWGAGNFVQSTGSISVVGTNGATFYITGVQLEAGSVATPFERRDYGRELMMCQRYFWAAINKNFVSGYNGSGGDIYADVPNPVAMRATPTVTLSSFSNSNAANAAINDAGILRTRVSSTITTTGAGYSTFQMASNAEL